MKTLNQVYIECKVRVRETVRPSRNKEVGNLYQLTSNKTVNTNCLLLISATEKYLFKNKATSVLSVQTNESIWNEFVDLMEQCGN